MGVFCAGAVGWNEFFYKMGWSEKSILAGWPKFHADWFGNGRATRKTPKNGPYKAIFLRGPPGFWTFERGSSEHTSDGPIWLKQIYRDMKFISQGLPDRCDEEDEDRKLTSYQFCFKWINVNINQSGLWLNRVKQHQTLWKMKSWLVRIFSSLVWHFLHDDDAPTDDSVQPSDSDVSKATFEGRDFLAGQAP